MPIELWAARLERPLTEKESGATAVLNDSVMEELMTRLELPEKGD